MPMPIRRQHHGHRTTCHFDMNTILAIKPGRTCSMQCERDECSFMLVEAVERVFCPSAIARTTCVAPPTPPRY
jgi:hypothetical protein